jgi:CopG-like RHH_1 or ribbon-helix-helix domain, RHH_5
VSKGTLEVHKPDSTVVSKRLNLSLPEHLYNDLKTWADHQGRSMANLANFLLERTISSAKESGEFPTTDDGEQAIAFLKKLAQGKRPTKAELIKIAQLLDESPEAVARLWGE